jgi:DNA-binding beta-propeller fold protein YncE
MGTTVAGTGGAGAAADRLSSPYHLIIDSSDALYIADFSNHRVQKFTAASSTGITVVGQPRGAAGNSLNDLTQPTCLLLDSNKNLYVSDTGNNRVLLFRNATAPGTLAAGTGKKVPKDEKITRQIPSSCFQVQRVPC